MSRRFGGVVLATVALCALTTASGCDEHVEEAPAPAARARPLPPIVLIVVDSLRADHLSLLGYPRPTTPHLDAFARESTVYRRAYAQAPWTTASVGSLLSSRYPSEIGLTAYARILPPELVTLPEALQQVGYATHGAVSHEFVSRRWGFAQGFDHFDERFDEGPDAPTSDGISDLALAWIEAQRNQPFFLFLHYADTHAGYNEHEDFPFGGRGSYDGPVQSGQLPPAPAPAGSAGGIEHGVSAADLEEMRRLYDSEIAHTDRAIGRVLDGLRERGLFEDSLIIVTADHGEEFLDHGGFLHARTVYDELIHVPLLIHYPDARAAVVDAGVALADIYPTVIDVAELRRGSGLRGRSLRDVASDTWPQPVFTETTFRETPFQQADDGERRVRKLRAVIFGPHKLIAEAGDATHPARAELYNLLEDPGERSPLGDDHPAMERVAPMLRRWIEANVEPPPRRAPPDAVGAIDDEERKRLEALGYL